MTTSRGRILIVAGSDSGGGAGVQADLKTVTCLGGYASTAITALTAQNTLGVFGVVPVDPAFVALQMTVVLSDLGADAIKLGMLWDDRTIEAVASVLRAEPSRPALVVDPVMVAKGGASLLASAGCDALVRELFPMAELVTPNGPEAERLVGFSVRTAADAELAGKALLAKGPRAVLIKGGHLEGSDVIDTLVTAGATRTWRAPRIDSVHTHGTGCTMASAIATRLGQGATLEVAIDDAHAYVRAAIEHAPALGAGHGPLGHNLSRSIVR